MVLLFVYNKNMNIMRPRTDNDVAVYGITLCAGLGSLAFMILKCLVWLMIDGGNYLIALGNQLLFN